LSRTQQRQRFKLRSCSPRSWPRGGGQFGNQRKPDA
jgi:hypothetical protein